MSIVAFAEEAPDRIALVYGNGESRETYAELEARSRRTAHLLRACGLQEGDSIAALLGTMTSSSTSTGPRCGSASTSRR